MDVVDAIVKNDADRKRNMEKGTGIKTDCSFQPPGSYIF